MGGACSRNGETKSAQNLAWKALREETPFGVLGVDVTVISKQNLN
jgi:hypothetical protein